MKKVLILSFLVVFLNSCNYGKLSNEEALEILKNNYIEKCYGSVKKSVAHNNPNKKEKFFLDGYKKLEKEGYITTNKSGPFTFIHLTKKSIEFKGNSNYKYYLILSNFEVDKIIGISQKDNKTAIVNFNVKKINTPFEIISANNRRDCDYEKGGLERSIEFIKYDTGWKIKK